MYSKANVSPGCGRKAQWSSDERFTRSTHGFRYRAPGPPLVVIWSAMHWGFRRPAYVLWCAAGRIAADEARAVLGIDTYHPIDMVLFYREMVKELTPDRELARMIVDVMPLLSANT